MSPEHTLYSNLRGSYETIIRSVAATASDFEALLREVHDEPLVSKGGYTQKAFQTFRERADSELLSIAFFGAFSSGKSFLISGLNKKIELYEHQGKDQYVPLLPTSGRHTSSCPLAVEPLPSSEKEDKFWVTFEGEEAWEQKVPAKGVIIQAYVTDLPNARAQRLSNPDRARTVLKARLGVASAVMQARLYDMPGFGAIGVNYEDVIRSFIQQADCIVYVAWAVRTLDEKDLELLRDIYNHHKNTGKPVFFVLTQIDLAWDIDYASGRVKWEDILEANNSFLEKNFVKPDGKPDKDFIGKGFTPVSAALEAKGLNKLLQDPGAAEKLIEESKMRALRDRFNEYLRTTSGPMHLAELISEVQRLLQRLAHDIRLRAAAESTPLDDARKAIKAYKAQRSMLIEGKARLEEELLQLGQAAVRRAFAGSDPDNLAALLSERLESKILSSDVLSEEVIHEIETEKSNVVREWLGGSTRALIPRWVKSWEAFVSQSTERLENLLEQAATEQHKIMRQDEDEDEADISDAKPEDRLKSGYSDAAAETFKATLDVISTTWKTWTVVAGLGATGLIGSTFPALAAIGVSTAGWGLLATAVVGAAYGKWKLSRQRQERRELMTREIPEYSQRVVNSYQAQADEFVKSRIGLLLEAVDDEIDRISNSINSLEQRLLTGEYVDRNKRLETLGRLTRQCSETESLVNKFYREASSIQPGVSVILGDAR